MSLKTDIRQVENIYRALLGDDKFLRWTLCPDDELDAYWKKYLMENPDNIEEVNTLRSIIRNMRVAEEPLTPSAQSELWSRIQTSVSRDRQRRRMTTFLRYAAAIAAVVALGTWLYVHYAPQQSRTVDYQALVSETVDNLTGNVTLVLPGDEKIEVSEANVDVVHDALGKLRVNQEIVKEKSASSNKTDNFNRLIVPYGKTGHVVMSDGTNMWVNSGSRVVYPAVFEDNRREIYVDGEVYLEVSPNASAPFVVKTDRMEVRVLGTVFNVSAYKNDEVHSVVLAEGSVKVRGTGEKQETTLRPRERFTLNAEANRSQVENVDVMDYICWKYGFLSFKRETLTSVFQRLERYYNVRMEYDVAAASRATFSGKLDLKDDIAETFRIISVAAPVKYKVETDKIIIEIKSL